MCALSNWLCVHCIISTLIKLYSAKLIVKSIFKKKPAMCDLFAFFILTYKTYELNMIHWGFVHMWPDDSEYTVTLRNKVKLEKLPCIWIRQVCEVRLWALKDIFPQTPFRLYSDHSVFVPIFAKMRLALSPTSLPHDAMQKLIYNLWQYTMGQCSFKNVI
jgi:hypothetical protein